MQAGDLLLLRGGTSLSDRIIKIGTRSVWSHVAISMDGKNLLVEATHTGIAFADARKYENREVRWIDTGLTEPQRIIACRFASSCVGQTYGTAQIAAIVASWLSGKRWYIGRENTEDCASFAARCIEHGGVILGKSPELYRPRDFADLFNVTPRLERP